MPQSFASLHCHIVFSTKNRHPLIAPGLQPRVFKYMGGILRNNASSLVASGGMPDHVHLLIEGQREDSDCREFISRAKQYSGFHYRATFGQRLWQRYGFERTLRSEEFAVSVARYILENPVRAGLVERIDQYEFSGSSVYTIEQILEAVQLGEDWDRRSG